MGAASDAVFIDSAAGDEDAADNFGSRRVTFAGCGIKDDVTRGLALRRLPIGK